MTTSDIIDWLSNCQIQAECDGYQQNEKSEDRWYTDGPPEVVGISGSTMIVTAAGEEFTVRITKKRKSK